MKKALLAATVSLFAAAAQADDIYRVEAHLAFNGNDVAVYRDDIPDGATGYYSKTLKRPETEDVSQTGEMDTGFTFTATPYKTADGTYFLSFTVSSTQKAPDDDRGLPVYEAFETGGDLKVTDNTAQFTSSDARTSSWSLTVSAMKI